MLRQMMKLRQAKRAFKDGRYQEALDLAADPEIAEHLQAQELRQACLGELRRRVDDLEARGELSLAMLDLERIRHHHEDRDVQAHERDLQKRIDERNEAGGRARQRFFRARLEVERGELASARQLLDSIGEGERTVEVHELMREIDERRASASEALVAARAQLTSNPARAEEIARDAVRMDPRVDGWNELQRDLARARVRVALDGKLSDGAFCAFLLDWGLFKRRMRSGQLDAEIMKHDADLARNVVSRVRAHLAAGSVAPAERLLDRQGDVLAGDDTLTRLKSGINDLETARVAHQRGDYGEASDALKRAEGVIGRLAVIKDLERVIAASRRAVQPLVDRARTSFERDDLVEARTAILDALDLAPLHREATTILRRINDRLTDRRARLEKARELLAQGRLESANAALRSLAVERGADAEVGLLLRELSILERSSPKPLTSAVSPPAPDTGHALALEGPAQLGAAWVLSIEEFGEILVLERNKIVIGNFAGGVADLPLMAAIAPRHAMFVRSTSFHGGVVYSIEAIDGRPLEVNGKSTSRADLADGDRIRLGKALSFSIRFPVERSKAALIDLPGEFAVDGARRVVLLPASGRAGALVIGSHGCAHVTTHGIDGGCEFYREPATAGGQLVVQGPLGVAVDGDESRARASIEQGASVKAGDLRIGVRAFVGCR